MNFSGKSKSWYLCLRVLRHDVNLRTLETPDLCFTTGIWKQCLNKTRGGNEITLESLKSCCILPRKKICSYQISDVIMSLQHEILTVRYCAKIRTEKFLQPSFFIIFKKRFKQRNKLLGVATTRWNDILLSKTTVQLVPTGYKEQQITMRKIRHWSRLPRVVVQSPSLDVFKAQLVKTLSNPVWFQSWPCFEQEVRLETTWGVFWPKCFVFTWVVGDDPALWWFFFLTCRKGFSFLIGKNETFWTFTWKWKV